MREHQVYVPLSSHTTIDDDKDLPPPAPIPKRGKGGRKEKKEKKKRRRSLLKICLFWLVVASNWSMIYILYMRPSRGHGNDKSSSSSSFRFVTGVDQLSSVNISVLKDLTVLAGIVYAFFFLLVSLAFLHLFFGYLQGLTFDQSLRRFQ